MVREQVRNGAPGLPVFLGLLVVMAATVALFVMGVRALPEEPRLATLFMVSATVEGSSSCS